MKEILASVISTLLLIGVCEAGEYTKYKQPDNNGITPGHRDKSQEASGEETRYLSDVHASIGAATVSGGDYRLKTTREVQLDLLRIREWYFHFGVQETSLYEYTPSQLDHQLYYFKTGYETDNGRVSVFWDHTCNNPTRKLPEGKFNQIHWNEFGIGYETSGMLLGHENDGISFNDARHWLNKIDWSAALSLVWMKHDNDYEYMFKPAIRDDILRIGNHVLYAQGRINAIYDERGINYNTSIEAGDRIHLGRGVCLLPFVSYEHFHDWYGLGEGEDFYLAGLRLEAPLGPDNSGGLSKNRNSFEYGEPADNSSYFPLRFHVDGGYNQNLHGTKDRCNSSDVAFDLDLLKFDDDKILTVNSYAGMLTEPGSFDIQNINYKIGPSLNIDLTDSNLRFFHSYSCLYGENSEGVIRKYNLFGAELGHDARLSWRLQGVVYPTTTHFDYYSHLQATMGYDFCTGKLITPYIDGSLKYLLGKDPVFGNAVETGLKISGEAGKFVLYTRLEDSYDVFRFGQGEQLWLGFRIILSK